MFLVSIFLFTFSNSYADSDMLSVSSKYYGYRSQLNTVGDGSYTITASDVFAGGGSSNGGSFHLYASFLVYPSDIQLMQFWSLEVYVNGVQVLYRSFTENGIYSRQLDEYITAKEGDVVRIRVYPAQVTGVGSTTATDTFDSYSEATVHFGLV